MRKISLAALMITLCAAGPAIGQSILDAPLLEVEAPPIVEQGSLPPAPESDDPIPENPYYDDRSTAASVVESLYNAINRAEYLRAWSYFASAYDEEQDPQAEEAAYGEFVAGYADTQSVRVLVGAEMTEDAAGTIYHTLPVAIEAVDTNGTVQSFSGCYTLRLTQPAVQEVPPFRPLAITEGSLAPAEGPLETILPGNCAPLN